MKTRIQLLIAALLAAGSFSLLPAQRTVRINLERMVQKSGAIVHATVLNVESGRDVRSRLLYTAITVRVHENFYGAPDSLYTFRQFGGTLNGVSYYPTNMRRYKPGQELILMLYPSSKTGFQSPVGADQGVFTVKKNSSGIKIAVNAFSNRMLLQGVKETRTLGKLSFVQQSGSEGYPLSDFSQAIHSLVSIYKK